MKNNAQHVIQTVQDINDNSVVNTLIIVFRNQTEEEKKAGKTSEHNGVGFNGPDAEMMTSYVYQYLEKGTLSRRQMEISRKRCKKYWNQVHQFYQGNMKYFTVPWFRGKEET